MGPGQPHLALQHPCPGPNSRSEDAAMKAMYLDRCRHNQEKKRIVKQIRKLGFTPEELIELLSGE